MFSLIESINALLGGGAVCQNKHTHGSVMPSRRVSQHVGRSRTRGGATCWGFFLSVFMQIVFLFKRRAMRSLPPHLSLSVDEGVIPPSRLARSNVVFFQFVSCTCLHCISPPLPQKRNDIKCIVLVDLQGPPLFIYHTSTKSSIPPPIDCVRQFYYGSRFSVNVR